MDYDKFFKSLWLIENITVSTSQSGLNSCFHQPFHLWLRLNSENLLLKSAAFSCVLNCKTFKGPAHRIIGIEYFKELRMGQCSPERLQKQWAKVRFWRLHSGLSSVIQFYARGIFSAHLYISPLTLRIITHSLDKKKRILGKIWAFSDSESGWKEIFQFLGNDRAAAFKEKPCSYIPTLFLLEESSWRMQRNKS